MNFAIAISRSKNKLIILLLLLATQHVQAQKEHSYIPLLDTGKVWYTVQIGEFGDIMAFNMTPDFENPYFASDTAYYNIDGWIIVREDTINKKVYSRNFAGHNIPSGPEELLYDFSLEEGDSTYLQYKCWASGWDWYYVDSVRTKNLFSVDRKVWYINDHFSKSPNIIWIEGIGSLGGIQYSANDPNIWACGELTCCYHYDDLLYQSANGAQWGCSFEYVSVEELNNERTDIKFYPNPVQNISTLSFYNPENERITLRIFNSVGILTNIRTSSNSSFQIHANKYINGLYIYQLIKKNKIIHSDKFLISNK